MGSFDRTAYCKGSMYICSDNRRGQLSYVRVWEGDMVIANAFFESPEGKYTIIPEISRIKSIDSCYAEVV